MLAVELAGEQAADDQHHAADQRRPQKGQAGHHLVHPQTVQQAGEGEADDEDAHPDGAHRRRAVFIGVVGPAHVGAGDYGAAFQQRVQIAAEQLAEGEQLFHLGIALARLP